MAVEIERKYLVKNNGWRDFAGRGQHIRQAYLASSERNSVRIRIIDGREARLAIKSGFRGIERDEYEYAVPLSDAKAMLELRQSHIIEKTRYQVPFHDLTWEIDIFLGDNAGLSLVEVELTRADQIVTRTSWVGREVTGDPRYQNSTLAAAPISSWQRSEDAVASIN